MRSEIINSKWRRKGRRANDELSELTTNQRKCIDSRPDDTHQIGKRFPRRAQLQEASASRIDGTLVSQEAKSRWFY